MQVHDQESEIDVSPRALGLWSKRTQAPVSPLAPAPGKVPAVVPAAPTPEAPSQASLQYAAITRRLFDHVQQVVPIEATVLVVSKGDGTLLHLHGCNAWHYPQREDGVYAGYYPGDDGAAIDHLEALREKGATYIVFPSTAFWWFEKYTGFWGHLQSTYRVVLDDPEVCRIICLERDESQSGQSKLRPRRLVDYIHPALMPDVRALFDFKFYSTQAGDFPDADRALLHYLETGHAQGFQPHPLFDTAYYLTNNPEAQASRQNPLVHFIANGVCTLRSCHPIFDIAYYYEQRPDLRDRGVNAVVHYLTADSKDPAAKPNPLFSDEFYLTGKAELRKSGVRPLVHFVTDGCAAGCGGSSEHAGLIRSLTTQRPRRNLLRGRWCRGTVLIFAEGLQPAETRRALKLSEGLSEAYHMRPLTILMHRSGMPSDAAMEGSGVVLEDFRIACDIFRASALRMIVRSLATLSPVFAFVSTGRMLDAVQDAKLKYVLLGDGVGPVNVADGIRNAERVIFESSEDFLHLSSVTGRYPTNVTSLNSQQLAAREYAAEILDVVSRTVKLPEHLQKPAETRRAGTRKIIIPCGDWNVSGVNTAIQSVGRYLLSRGYEVELVFTRDRAWVAKSAGDPSHMPQIPYRFLDPDQPGPESMWEALIAHIESSEPCTVLTAYDFAANSVVPALSGKVGVVSWVQSDDCDYYEQVYRLGRYCNAVVCVSDAIRQKVSELNPAIGARTTVIHNSSICDADIRNRSYQRGDKLRLIYTGRLVQYQKRVMDVIDLAAALDRLKVPYEITLLGSFTGRERCETPFRARAAAHLADGRIVLPGRLPPEQILSALAENDYFILLSDFEGLPLSLIEAMGAGCVPAVAYMESGIPEAVTDGDNGLIMAGRDYDEWARRLVNQWNDVAGMKRLSDRARRTVRDRFTVERVAQQFAELFDNVSAEIESGNYQRPPCLHWGERLSPTGDVLPPATLYRQLSKP